MIVADFRNLLHANIRILYETATFFCFFCDKRRPHRLKNDMAALPFSLHISQATKEGNEYGNTQIYQNAV